ncbi:hypothetical protein FA13DRAFT_1724060 [Coprinellus micaceus]|uniref:Uncharacterized protein n=1 Tax=Coprinellus micaceus TaxID=71717 RepID=A0A4Y7U091_COPMI|nr:hypothetical protein FA13DRAFT_1724060 [Coprinellus micaceus]
MDIEDFTRDGNLLYTCFYTPRRRRCGGSLPRDYFPEVGAYVSQQAPDPVPASRRLLSGAFSFSRLLWVTTRLWLRPSQALTMGSTTVHT